MSVTDSSSPSLALRAVLKSAAARAGLVHPPARLTGLTGPAQALAVAVAAGDAQVVLVVPTDRAIEAAVADVRFFLAAVAGLSELDAERAVLAYPSQEVNPYRGLAPHFDITSARARALHAMRTGAAQVIVASARALLARVSSPIGCCGRRSTCGSTTR